MQIHDYPRTSDETLNNTGNLTVLCCSQYDSQYDILHTILFRWYIVINDFEHVFHNQAT